MKITKKFFETLLIALIPLLPDYFRLAGQPVYQYAIILLFLVVVNKRKIDKYEKNYILFFCIITMLFSFTPRIVHFDINPLLSFLLMPVLLSASVFLYLRDENDIEYLIDVFILTGIFACLLSFIECFSEFNVFSLIETVDLGEIGTASKMRDGIIRAEGSFGTAIAYGIYLCTLNVLCLYKLTSESEKRKLKYWSGYFLSAIALILTQSRMPIIVFAISQFAYFFKFKKIYRALLVTAFIVLFTVDCLTSKIIIGMISEYSELIYKVIMGNQSELDINSAYRVLLPSVLVPQIMQSPIVGFGQKFMSAFTFRVWGFDFTSIDNNYLGMLVRYGVMGLVGQLFPFVYALYLIVKMKFEEIAYPISLILIGYFINLISVAQMSEGRFLYMMVPLILRKYWIYKRGIQ